MGIFHDGNVGRRALHGKLERLLHGQEDEAENIGFGRENLFQQYKVRRVLERGGKGKAAFGIVARKFAVKQVVHFCSVSCRLHFQAV